MKFIHTADWHIGQTFHGYDRSKEHKIFLQWLANTIKSQKADALLIAGDIFDGPNPSAESQRLFYDFLHNITEENPKLKIIATAGNHDSAARLEAPSPILESFNIITRGIVQRDGNGNINYNHFIVPLNEDTCCLAVPYLRQGDYPARMSYNDGVNTIYEELLHAARESYNTIIAMGHLHANGGTTSANDQSERTVIGGLDCVDLSALAGKLDYMALGHLHKSQKVNSNNSMRYSGAPLPMSFAELNYRQSVTCVTIDKNEKTVESIPFDVPAPLLSIPKEPLPIEEVLKEISKLPVGETDHTSPYLEIRILIKEPEPSIRTRIEEALIGRAVRLARIEAVNKRGDSSIKSPLTYDELKELDPIELAEDIFCKNFGQEQMPEEMKLMLCDVIKEIHLAE